MPIVEAFSGQVVSVMLKSPKEMSVQGIITKVCGGIVFMSGDADDTSLTAIPLSNVAIILPMNEADLMELITPDGTEKH